MILGRKHSNRNFRYFFHFSYNINKILKCKDIKLTNNNKYTKRIVYIRPYLIGNEDFSFESKVKLIKGDYCTFGLISKNSNGLHITNNIIPNRRVLVEYSKKYFFLTVSIPPNSECIINNITLTKIDNKEQIINEYFKNDILLVSPGYPDIDNKYNCAFIHSRMEAYKKAGIKVDIAVVNSQNIGTTEIYKFENINAVKTGYNEIRLLLQTKKYKQILIHFFNEQYAQILDASDLSDTKVYLYSHGVDTAYWDYDKLSKKYFQPNAKIYDDLREIFVNKDEIIQRYNKLSNIKWVFVSNFLKNRSQELLKINYNNSLIIPCLINEKEFIYKKKDSSQRGKICIVRTFNNLSTYSLDIDVRIILELSKRKVFNKLYFSIYGDGDMHEILLSPIKDFSNVHIYKRFLSHDEMAKVYSKHGLALFATRYETQGVAACEAAMAGSVVITSKDVGTSEFIDEGLGTYCDTENIKQYADLIESLYYNKDKFNDISPKMHDSVMKTCGYNQTIKKDIDIIKNDKQTKLPKYLYSRQVDNPILTIAVPSYNVERFINNGIYSLIDQPFSNKLEILIINDGSKDKTSMICKDLEKLTTVGNRSIVRLIDKENGGHGSAINTGIKEAHGKYFRLMDGDDYFISGQLEEFIKVLENENSDIILTNYIEDFAISAVTHPVHHYDFMKPGTQYDINIMGYEGYGFKEWGPLLSTTTCKTSILKESDFLIDEHCFYVDMEYNFIIYLKAENVTYYPLDIYMYYLGREGQSISRESFKKNYLNHETVCIRLINEYSRYKNSISDNKKLYLINKIIIPLSRSQYMITTEYFNNSKAFLSFDKKLKKYPEFYNNPLIVGKIIKLHRISRGKTIYFDSIIKTFTHFIKRFKKR